MLRAAATAARAGGRRQQQQFRAAAAPRRALHQNKHVEVRGVFVLGEGGEGHASY
jgi:hypothetical protein